MKALAAPAQTSDQTPIPEKEEMTLTGTTRVARTSRLLLGCCSALIACMVLLGQAAQAQADVQWTATVDVGPSELIPGERAGIYTWFANSGDSDASAWPTITFDLPSGVTFASTDADNGWSCTGTTTAECTNFFGNFLGVSAFSYPLAGMSMVVDVDPAMPSGDYPLSVTLSDAGAASPTVIDKPIYVENATPSFGVLQDTFESGAFDDSGFTPGLLDPGDTPVTQAGAHPAYMATSFKMRTKFNDPTGSSDPSAYIQAVESVGQMKDVVADLPAGFVGDPTAVPQCTAQAATTDDCPPDSQVGVAVFDQRAVMGFRMAGIFNMVPSKNHPAEFRFNTPGGPVLLVPTLRADGTWGLRISLRDVSEANPIFASEVTFWGVPADARHDAQRCPRPNEVTRTCTGTDSLGSVPGLAGQEWLHEPRSSTAEPKAFLSNPTACTGDASESALHVSEWDDPAPFHPDGDPDLTDSRWKSVAAEFPPQTGCENLSFDPTIDVQPTNEQADSPTGLEVEVSIPQNSNPVGLATAHLKNATVTLPEGMSINPSSADGLGSCSPDQIGLVTEAGEEPVFNKAEGDCPQNSKIGTVDIDTPLLDDPLQGNVYVAQQNDNPFESTFALYFEVEGPGLLIKLAGEVATDETTGQIETTFLNNPQLPFDTMTVKLKGGQRAPLATPPTCGTHTTETELVSWADPHIDPANLIDSFEVTKGPNGGVCPATLADRPFDPTMNAGVTNPVAGSISPFIFRLKREDGHQEILSTTVTPPQGVTAKLAGIPLCGDTQATNGDCPDSSRVGTTLVGAGAGSSPFYIQAPDEGKVFMAGPYKGAPLSLAIEVPAKAGPFDLGVVNVRAAVHVDPRTAQLTVKSDPLPQILEGVPLRVRDIRVLMDRPDFTIAPTSCEQMEVGATIEGSHGASAELTRRFQVGECASLGFSPDLNLSFGKGKKNTKPNAHPPLNAKLSFNEGDSNISSVEVALPKGVLLDQARLGRICSRANYAANTCPEESRVGYAKANTPLLDDPVEGPVYLKASDNPLPDLAADLDGQIDVDLFGMIDQKENRKGLSQIRNTFDIVPDVPVSDFQLRLDGGNDGLLVNSRNICRNKSSQKVSIDMAAHNEMTSSSKPLIGSACKQLNKKKAKKLKKKAKKLQRKAKRANNPKKAKQLRKQARKLKQQARKLGR